MKMVVKLVVRELLLEVVVELEIDHQINWLRESGRQRWMLKPIISCCSWSCEGG